MSRRDEEEFAARQAEKRQTEVFSKGVAGADMLNHPQTDTAGAYGLIQGSQVMDKRICQKILHQRAHELEQQAIGVRRLADIVSVAADHDYQLFTILIAAATHR